MRYIIETLYFHDCMLLCQKLIKLSQYLPLRFLNFHYTIYIDQYVNYFNEIQFFLITVCPLYCSFDFLAQFNYRFSLELVSDYDMQFFFLLIATDLCLTYAKVEVRVYYDRASHKIR